MVTTGPALIFNIAVGPDAYANSPVLSSAITNTAPAVLPVLVAPSRGGFYTAQPRVDLMVRQVQAAIEPQHDTHGSGGGGSEGGSHHTSTHDTSSHDTSSHDTSSHDSSDTDSNTDHHHTHDTGSDTTSQPPGCH